MVLARKSLVRFCALSILFAGASLLPFAVSPVLAADQEKWIEVRSPHVAVLTNAGEKRGREVALRLEQMQAVFAGFLLRNKLAQPIPMTVIAFRGDKEFERIAPLDQGSPTEAPAFLIREQDRTFLALDLFYPEPWRAVSHDLAHVFMEGNYPPATSWFDEGLAEYFSSIRLDNKKVEIGGDPELVPFMRADINQAVSAKKDPPKPLTDFLLAPIWITTSDLLTMQNSPLEGTHRTLFYAQSWMMIHYLLAQRKMTETGVFFDALQNQKLPVEQAVQRAYGMSSKQLEQAVKDYFKSQTALMIARDEAQQVTELTAPQPFEYPSPIDADTAAYTVRPVADPEARVAVAELESRIPEHRSQSQSDLQAVLKEFPETPSAHRALGEIALATRKWDVALDELTQAASVNERDGLSRYYLAVAKFREAQFTGKSVRGLANALLDLRAAVEWYPEFAEAYNLLGLGRIEGGGIGSAAEAMQAAMRLNPRNEWYPLNLAKIDIEGKKFDAARALLEHLKTSGNQQVAAAAKQQLKDLAITEKYGISPQRAKEKAEAEAEEAASAAKEAAENTRPVEAPPDKRPILFAKGTILSVDCSQDPVAIVTMATSNRTLKLHVADKAKVIVIGEDKFSCRWQATHATANYKAAAKVGEGDLVSIEVQ